MKFDTSVGITLDESLIKNYFRYLVDHFFKILPMREQEDESLKTYMTGFLLEILGCQSLIPEFGTDAEFLKLASTLQYLIDNPETSVRDVKRSVFGAISVCNHLKTKYLTKGVVSDE